MPKKKQSEQSRLDELNDVFDKECAIAFSELYHKLKASPIRPLSGATRGGILLGETLMLSANDWRAFNRHEQEIANKTSELARASREIIIEMSNHIRTVAFSRVKQKRADLVQGVVTR